MSALRISVVVLIADRAQGLQAIAEARVWVGSHHAARATYPTSELVIVDPKFDENAALFSSAAADAFVALRHVKLDRAPSEVAFDYGLLAAQGEIAVFSTAAGLGKLDLPAIAAHFAEEAHRAEHLQQGTIVSVWRAQAIKARRSSFERVSVAEHEATEAPAVEDGPIVNRSVEDVLRVVMVYGEFSSSIRGKFDLPGLYETVGLTGSEGSFFNLARTLAELGHEVAVLCACERPYDHPSGAKILPIESIHQMDTLLDVDAVLAWNEPDYLRKAPAGALRVCAQQLNDFGYCAPGYEDHVDVWVSPSENHVENVMRLLPREPIVEVIPNSVDLDLFVGPAPERDPHRAIWCSSPDRGLHLLLDFWPLVRRLQPKATLRIFYRLRAWIDMVRAQPTESGRRARFIEAALPRLAAHGVEVHDAVSNRRMATELRSAAALLYPCDPVRYTEGFGCSVLDAAAAGCVPVIQPADALGEVHGAAAVCVQGFDRETWAKEAAARLSGQPTDVRLLARMAAHAETHGRDLIAERWVDLIRRYRG